MGNATRAVPFLGGWRVLHIAADSWELAGLVADEQRGLVTRPQLILCGFSNRMVDWALRRGQLHRRARGIYAVGHTTAPPLQAEAAGLLTAGSFPTLTGLTVLRARRCIAEASGAPVDVCALQGAPRSRPGIRIHRYRDLTAKQVHLVDGLPMTTVERALLDAADTLAGRELERAMDEALAAKLTSRTKVAELAAGAKGRKGAPLLLALADQRRPNSVTNREAAELALKLIREAGLPHPETEVTLYDGYTADFWFADARLVVEVDSFTFHGKMRANFNRDRRKDRVFRGHGLEVVRVTADELRDTPLVFIADLAQAVARRLTQLQAG